VADVPGATHHSAAMHTACRPNLASCSPGAPHLDADGAHARAASAMRDAERLVQVQVAHVRADEARGRQPNLWYRGK
jgi:hypothetical protein